MSAAAELADDGIVQGINVTPMVDIMLVLLIIFMVTARLTSDSEVKIHLPEAATAAAPTTASLAVTLDGAGGILLGTTAVDLEGLKANLRRESKLNPGLRVTVAADGSLPYRSIVKVLDAVRGAGVTRVGLAAEKAGA